MSEEIKETAGAEMNPQGQSTEPNAAGGESGASAPGQIVLTAEEFEKKLQAEADKRVTSALKTAQQKWEVDYQKRLDAERKEAEKLAKLSEEERSRVLEDKREKELEERERTIYRKELEIAAIKILDGKKLPVKFASLFLGKDAEETHANIETFEKEWHTMIEEQVNERLKGITPKATQPGQAKLSMNDIIRGQTRRR